MADAVDSPKFGMLQHKHPDHVRMINRWTRYRAVLSELDDEDELGEYLPKGALEFAKSYRHRLRLTKFIGWSAPAVDRMSGTLTGSPSKVAWDKSEIKATIQTKLKEFRDNIDGAGKSIDSWWKDIQPDVLGLGAQIVEVARDAIGEDGAEPLPFVCIWQPEELWDWELDRKGNFVFAKFVRTELYRESPFAPPQEVTAYRFLTVDGTTVYRQKPDQGDDDFDAEPVFAPHKLGRCPVTILPARRRKGAIALAYIDQISQADLRVLQLESDQASASYNHGTPPLKIWTDQLLGTHVDTDEDGNEITREGLGLGDGQALKFRLKGGEEEEDAEYLVLPTGGMEVRETIITRTQMQALNAAGIDTSTILTAEGGSGSPRSGASLAQSFSQAEVPVLNAFTDSMEMGEREVMEIATRWMTPGGPFPPSKRLFDAVVTRPRDWQLLSSSETLSIASGADSLVPSPTFRRLNAVNVAKAALPKISDEQLEQIEEEVKAAIVIPQRPVTPNEAADAETESDFPESELDSDE